jgi:uncharacterized protein (TIGR03067 family)
VSGKVVLPLALVLFWTGQSAVGPAQNELTKLQGTWSVSDVIEAGVRASDEPGKEKLQSAEIRIEGDRLTFKWGWEVLVDRIKVDPNRKPAWIDLDNPEHRLTGVEFPFRGIYELKGDALKICVNFEWIGNQNWTTRPEDFISNWENGVTLFILRRKSQ